MPNPYHMMTYMLTIMECTRGLLLSIYLGALDVSLEQCFMGLMDFTLASAIGTGVAGLTTTFIALRLDGNLKDSMYIPAIWILLSIFLFAYHVGGALAARTICQNATNDRLYVMVCFNAGLDFFFLFGFLRILQKLYDQYKAQREAERVAEVVIGGQQQIQIQNIV